MPHSVQMPQMPAMPQMQQKRPFGPVMRGGLLPGKKTNRLRRSAPPLDHDDEDVIKPNRLSRPRADIDKLKTDYKNLMDRYRGVLHGRQ